MRVTPANCITWYAEGTESGTEKCDKRGWLGVLCLDPEIDKNGEDPELSPSVGVRDEDAGRAMAFTLSPAVAPVTTSAH